MTQITVDEVDHLVRQWLATARTKPVNPAARRLADVLRDPDGLSFTVGFVDRVIRPEDVGVAARALRELRAPRFLPWHLRAALRLGALVSIVAPGIVIPVVRRVLRQMVGHLLVDASDAGLGKAIARIRERGVSLNVNLLGEAVLGEREAARRLAGVQRLLARSDVDYVSVKVSATVPPHSPWAYDETVEHVAERLLPLFQLAAREGKFINLDMEEYRDLDLTVAVFERLLDREDLLGLESGIVLQAYLPDALGAMMRLQAWAADRVARGGARVKVRLVKGANLPMEKVESSLRGWPLATYGTKQDTDTNYKRVLTWALHPERTRNIRLGVAGHNLFDIAYAWLLAGERGVRDDIEFEMLLGMAEGQAEAVRETVGGLLLYVPVVHPREFDVAIAYLVRRLEEGASQDNFMSAVFDLADSPELLARERDRFARSLAALEAESRDVVPGPNRTGARPQPTRFENAPDTDPSLPASRQWGRAILERVPGSRLGEELVEQHTVIDLDTLDKLIEQPSAWGTLSGVERGQVLRRAAEVLESRRGDLVEVMASECGKTIDQGDPEVSEAIDFARYYADLAEELDTIAGARHVPVGLTVVTPPWNFPTAIPAGSTLAALAAGSPVVIKPATQARRTGAVMVQALWSAGIPEDALRLVYVDEGDLGRRLVSHPAVDRLILTGAFETASLFRSFRPDLPLLAETSGKNALVVTPDADLDLAVRDLVASAFGHAGQKCSAASLAILVGSVATSRRFRDQLVDAVTSLQVGYPQDPSAQMGPLIEPASGKLLRALTTLEPGEEWLVKPRQIDERLWTPGVKTGVAPGSEFHLTEYFGPVLGLMSARTLEEAIQLQNAVPYGLTAGLHSLDRGEVETWLERVEAGNVYVNRGTTGAIVRRQPFGGWKRSAVGAGTKAGGPNYLIGLSDWAPDPSVDARAASSSVEVRAESSSVEVRAESSSVEVRAESSSVEVRAERASKPLTDAEVWATHFAASDVSGLEAERNVLRYRPVPVTIRYEGGDPADLRRVLAAGRVARAPMTVSCLSPLPEDMLEEVRAGASYAVETDDVWAARLTSRLAPSRVRLLGGDRGRFAEQSRGRVDIALYDHPVVASGRIEILPFVHEQAVAVTAHRFGSPTALADVEIA